MGAEREVERDGARDAVAAAGRRAHADAEGTPAAAADGPADPEDAPDGDPKDAPDDPGGGEPGSTTVLVIDDEPAIRTLVRMLLDRSDSFELAGEAVEGTEGIELATRLQPDIVLLDLLMEGVGGREALPYILRESPRSMVVVLSALSGVDEAEPSFASGAFAYVEKSALGRLTEELTELHTLFERALDGETVWAPGGPTRVRR